MTAQVTARTGEGRVHGGRPAAIALWALQGLTAIMIFGAGVATLAGAAQPVEIFDAIGFGDWFRYLTGGLQVVGAVGLLVPRLSGAAALAFVGMWVSAVATHLFGIGGSPAAATVFLGLTAVIAWARRRETTALLARRAR